MKFKKNALGMWPFTTTKTGKNFRKNKSARKKNPNIRKIRNGRPVTFWRA